MRLGTGIFVTLILLLCITLVAGGCTTVVGKGQKVGTVIKVSDEGLFNTTHEAEIIRGGMANGSGGFSTTPLHVTINDPDLLRKTQAALEGQYEVRVWYTEYFATPWSSGSHGWYMTQIERVSEH